MEHKKRINGEYHCRCISQAYGMKLSDETQGCGMHMYYGTGEGKVSLFLDFGIRHVGFFSVEVSDTTQH